MHRTIRASWALLAALGLPIVLTGCNTAGPDHTATANYTAPGDLPRINTDIPVAVSVEDIRAAKGDTRDDGREVIASGTKGKIFFSEPPAKTLERNLIEALTKAGYTVDPAAKVVIDARLRQLVVTAPEFTNWNIDPETGSTIDAIRGLLPGPIRETKAETMLDIVLRKNDQRLGFSYPVTTESKEKSRDRAVVDRMISQSMTAAINDAIRKAAPDINTVAKLPVSDAEIQARAKQIDDQLRQFEALRTELQRQQSVMVSDRADLAKLRASIDADRKAADADRKQLATLRATVEAQANELRTRQEAVTAAQKQLNATQTAMKELESLANARTQEQEQELTRLKAENDRQRQQVTQAQQQMTAKELELAQLRTRVERASDLTGLQSELAQQRQRLIAREQEINAQEQSLTKVQSALTKKQQELARQDESLKKWERDLKSKSEPRPDVTLTVNMRPMIAVVEPQPATCDTRTPRMMVKGVIMDDRGIVRKRFTVNGQEVAPRPTIQVASGAKGFTIESVPAAAPAATKGVNVSTDTHVFENYAFIAQLKKGRNDVAIEAWDEGGQSARETVTIQYDPGEGQVFVVAIGINNYQSAKVPKLKYAAADAQAIAKVIQERLAVPAANITVLVDDQATLQNLKHTLGVKLQREAAKQDMAVIFFSGHGAPEEDASSPDQDGLEKYLLPVDTDIDSLFSTAMPMKDVTDLLRRLACERVVFIADTCYSGAAGNGAGGARTVATPGKTFRAFSIERVVDRLGGTGRIIMTASKGSEISQEKDDLGHGVFTYYVAEGLSGKADKNRDYLVTANELYDYVSIEVPKATGNSQNPLMSKDEAVGEIVLSELR